MNSQEFVVWLKGFTEGVHEYNITPKQWDILKEKLAQVSTSEETYPITYRTNGAPNWYSSNKIENDSGNK